MIWSIATLQLHLQVLTFLCFPVWQVPWLYRKQILIPNVCLGVIFTLTKLKVLFTFPWFPT
jgi:hypothetical protein